MTPEMKILRALSIVASCLMLAAGLAVSACGMAAGGVNETWAEALAASIRELANSDMGRRIFISDASPVRP